MKRFFSRIPVRIPPLSLCFFCLLLWIEPSAYTLLPLLAALTHEAGHVVALCATQRKIRLITLYPFGIDIQTGGTGTYGQDLFVSAAGVIANLLACALCAPHLEFVGVQCFFASNLLLALLNLLPVESLDGHAILSALLFRFCDFEVARTTLRRISFAALLVLWIVATYILFFTGSNFSFFTMTLYLFACLFLGNPKKPFSANK